jgi:DNA-binding MarR family transcriptional regulator
MNTDRIIALISTIREKSHRFIIQELRKRQIRGIVPSHGAILAALYKQDTLPMAELAQIINRDKSTVTTLVEKLVGLGYVKKVQSLHDKRVTQVCLTEKGKSLKPALDEISREMLDTLYHGFSDLEREMVVRLLERMLSNW